MSIIEYCSLLIFNVSINRAEFVGFVMPTLDTPYHIRSAGQINSLAYKLTKAQPLPNSSTRNLIKSPDHQLKTQKLTTSYPINSPTCKLTYSQG